MYLNEPIGKDKDDNEISLIDILENDEKNIEDEIDFKLKMKRIHEKIKSVLKKREQIIIELRFGLGGKKPKTQNEVAEILRNISFICIAKRLIHIRNKIIPFKEYKTITNLYIKICTI